MARYNQKRKASGGPTFRTFKKARPMRRRRFSSRKNSNWTSQSSKPGGITFKKRRFGRARWKNLLWTSTQGMTHYRSSNAAATTLTCAAGADLNLVSLQTSRRFAGNAFWVTAGGAVNPDGGVMPTFSANSDITVRGGVYGIRIGNIPDLSDANKDSINVVIYLIKTSKGFTPASVPATSVSVGWDPTLIADFQTTIGKVILRKNFLVNEGDSFTIERRMSVQKVDQTEYGNLISEYQWMVVYGNTAGVSANTLKVTTYYNMSFSGDTV